MSDDEKLQEVRDMPRRYPSHKSPAEAAAVLQEAMQSGITMARGKTPAIRIPANETYDGKPHTILPRDIASDPWENDTHFGTMDSSERDDD